MLKQVEKKCIISDDSVDLTLTDTRDNYVVKTALGAIGTISISKDGIFIYPSYESIDDMYSRIESELLQAFAEIFGTREFNPLSPNYYSEIKVMIENGSLQKLGYTIEKRPEYDYTGEEEMDLFNRKKSGKR